MDKADKDRPGTLADQLQTHFRGAKDERRNAAEDDINKALSKDFEQWLAADVVSSDAEPKVGSSLRRNKARYEPVGGGPAPAEEKKDPSRGILQGMDSRRIYEQLTLKQKKEIAWLLREEGIV